MITSEEINYLIYRYLQEAGFMHSSFAFGNESFIYKANIKAELIPPGALINLIQKGIQYTEIELHLNEDGSQKKCNKPFRLLENHICEHSESSHKDGLNGLNMIPSPSNKLESANPPQKRKEEKSVKKLDKKKKDIITTDKDDDEVATNDNKDEVTMMYKGEEREIPFREIGPSEVRTLSRHTKEVFACAWNPKKPLLASTGSDGLAIIWDLGKSEENMQPIILDHRGKEQKPLDITTLDWHSMASYLATGTYDGLARIWDDQGDLVHILKGHKEPIFTLKWNKRGNCLLTGSFDKSTIIWDAHVGEIKQSYEFHTGPVLAVDWKNNTTFASCSADKTIHICKLNEKRPIKTFTGHTEDINSIKWDPSSNYLASGSDDGTAKIWDMSHSNSIYNLTGHEKEIYAIEWSPTGPKSENPNMNVLLATASFDNSTRLWDLETGKCLYKLERHTQPVYSLAYSPNGRFIATGSFDQTVHIWNASDGKCVRTYTDQGRIYDLAWKGSGDKLAVCTDQNKIHVLDFRI